MQSVILAGGLGTRLAEKTTVIPKPLVDIGGMPVLWHIMKIYSHFGINDFIICLGYKGQKIKEFFLNYHSLASDVTVKSNGEVIYHNSASEDWNVSLIDTGEDTQTGGRLKRIFQYIDGDDLCMTYGDGLADVNISDLIKFHRNHGKLATLTAANPPARFGSLTLSANDVTAFVEKPVVDDSYINGGFFVLNKRVGDYIAGDETIWEREPLQNLSKNSELKAFLHHGFWHPMDTLRERNALEEMWAKKSAPWKVW